MGRELRRQVLLVPLLIEATESVKKDRTLFLTGAVLFALSLRGRAFPTSLLERPSLLQLGLLALLGLGAWTRRLRPALAGAAGLLGIQALLPGVARIQASGSLDPDAVLPVLLWGVAIAANVRKERREVYFEA